MSLPEYSADSVFGHYVHKKGESKWEPLIEQSRELFRAVVADDHMRVEEEVKADPSKAKACFILLYWGGAAGDGDSSKTNVTVKQRTLLMLAAYHGCMRVVSTLVMNGAVPGQLSVDGLDAYQMAIAGDHPCAGAVVAYLKEAEGISQSPGEEGCAKGKHSERKGSGSPKEGDNNGSGPPTADECGLGSELTKPEYSTDHFRMLCFKVLRCMKRSSHDWRCCPFAHNTENARRRDPMDHRYSSISCPDYKRGFCIRGDKCPYAHGIYESWLHPSRYRTQLCKDGKNCRRPVCFFAHSVDELRAPTHNWVPTSEDLKNATEQVMLPISAKAREPESESFGKKIKNKPKKSALTCLPGEQPKPHSQGDDANPQRVVAPRMSNAFARRHGLNPKDDPSIVLQKMSETGLQLMRGPGFAPPQAVSQPEEPPQKSKSSEDVLPWGIHPKANPMLVNGSQPVPGALAPPDQLHNTIIQSEVMPHPVIPIATQARAPAVPMQMPPSLPNSLHGTQMSFGGLSLHSSPSTILTQSILAPELQEEVLIDGRITPHHGASPYGDGSGISLLREFSGNLGSYTDASTPWFPVDEQNPVNTFPGAGSLWLPQYY